MKDENILGTKPVIPLLMGMAFPIMISMLVQALYSIVDSIFVAKYSAASLIAVSLAYPLQMLIIAVAVGTSVGVNALLSRRLGEGNREAASKVAHNGVILMGISWAVFAAFGLLFTDFFFSIFTEDAIIAAEGSSYLRICMVFSLGVFLQVLMERLIQVSGNTLYQMLSQLTGAIVNIVLDPILIFGLLGAPRLGTTGAAIATVVGQFVGFFLCFFLNQRFNPEIHLRWQGLKWDTHTVKNIYSVGLPSIIMQSISSVMNLGMNKILVNFSDIAVSVLGVYLKLQSFVFMPVFGVTNAMVPIIGYNFGARKRKRITDTVKTALVVVAIIMGLGTLLFQRFPQLWLSMFSSENMDEVIRIGVPALRIISLNFLVAGVAIVLSSTFQALNNGIYSLLMSLIRQLVVLLPIAWLLSLTGRLELVWYSFTIAELFSIVLAVIFYSHLYKNKISVMEEPAA